MQPNSMLVEYQPTLRFDCLEISLTIGMFSIPENRRIGYTYKKRTKLFLMSRSKEKSHLVLICLIK